MERSKRLTNVLGPYSSIEDGRSSGSLRLEFDETDLLR